jgi:hypothetical protein
MTGITAWMMQAMAASQALGAKGKNPAAEGAGEGRPRLQKMSSGACYDHLSCGGRGTPVSRFVVRQTSYAANALGSSWHEPLLRYS